MQRCLAPHSDNHPIASAARLLLLVLMALAAAVFPAHESAAQDDPIDQPPESVGMSTQRLRRLDRNLEGYVERGEVAGVVALIARRGKVVYHRSFGQRHIEAQDAMTHDTIMLAEILK